MVLPYPQAGWMRLLSFLLAASLTTLILVYPRAVAASLGDVRHGVLTLLMCGIAGGFVHGVGFVPRLLLWRLVFQPLLAWALMVGGIAYILAAG